MSFVVRKLRLAEEDALEAAIWYEGRQTGLGGDFLDEIDRAVRALSGSALHNRIRFADVRRAAVARFKFYGIYYTVQQNEVWILAIFHGRRHPRVLQARVARLG
jgi:toxin ParE1/3/4